MPAAAASAHGLAALQAEMDAAAVWAFRDLPAAQGFAATRGLVPVRGLLVLAKLLDDVVTPEPPPVSPCARSPTPTPTPSSPPTRPPSPTTPSRVTSPAPTWPPARPRWWDPAGLLLAVDADGVAGFHWTKRHDATTGEVYVLGVHPRAAGRGSAASCCGPVSRT